MQLVGKGRFNGLASIPELLFRDEFVESFEQILIKRERNFGLGHCGMTNYHTAPEAIGMAMRTSAIRRVALLALAAAFLVASIASAQQEVRVVTSGGFTEAYKQLVPQFERETKIHVISGFGASLGATPDAIPNRLKRGEAIDVIILAGPGLDALIKEGMVDPSTRVPLVRSLIAMAVRNGTPKPDISTVEGLKRTLLQAKSIGSSDSASGVYLRTVLFPRLGIAEQIKGKSKVIEAYERVGDALARGDIDIGFQQVSELKPVPGITIVAPLPEGAQEVTIFSAAIPKGAKNPQAAKRLIQFLSSPAVATVVRQTGLEPIH
jgi:molybdate transport system substrate-binding protein